jgi:hypothetical protein
MASEYFVRRGEKVVGPVSIAKIRRMAAEGRIQPTDQLGKHPGGPWAPASRAKGLFPIPDTRAAQHSEVLDGSQSVFMGDLDFTRLVEVAEGEAANREPEPPVALRKSFIRNLARPIVLVASGVLLLGGVSGLAWLVYGPLSTSRPAAPQSVLPPNASSIRPAPVESAITNRQPVPTQPSESVEPDIGQVSAGGGHRLGPKIKGLQLGMSLSDAKQRFRAMWDPGTDVTLKAADDESPTDVEYAVWSVETQLGVVWVDQQDKVTLFRLAGRVTDKTFNSKELRDEDFLQRLVDSYRIPSLRRVDGWTKPGDGFEQRYEQYEYSDPQGWRIRVLIDDFQSWIGNRHTRDIVVYRITGDQDLKFD